MGCDKIKNNHNLSHVRFGGFNQAGRESDYEENRNYSGHSLRNGCFRTAAAACEGGVWEMGTVPLRKFIMRVCQCSAVLEIVLLQHARGEDRVGQSKWGSGSRTRGIAGRNCSIVLRGKQGWGRVRNDGPTNRKKEFARRPCVLRSLNNESMSIASAAKE
ncbi:MAG: hypothetical protein VX970_07155 [Planctomycetota bacterium]|nr:hypothetical protein [Planctomycetota bacterium]